MFVVGEFCGKVFCGGCVWVFWFVLFWVWFSIVDKFLMLFVVVGSPVVVEEVVEEVVDILGIIAGVHTSLLCERLLKKS